MSPEKPQFEEKENGRKDGRRKKVSLVRKREKEKFAKKKG